MVKYKHALQSPVRLNFPMVGRIHHAFVVFTSIDKYGHKYFWSIEKNMEAIVMQKSTILDDVRDNLRGTARTAPVFLDRRLIVNTTMSRLFYYLCAMHQQHERYQLGTSNCQKFAELVFSEFPETCFARRTLQIKIDHDFILSE